MKTTTVLAVGAHPDDLEILCGGTLARYARMGSRVIMAHILNGDKGHYTMNPRKLAKLRRREAQAAGRVIGAQVIGLDLPDGELFSTLATRNIMIDLVRKTRPDVVIAHGPVDYASDHTAASQLACDASYYAAAPLYKTRLAAHAKIPPVIFMDSVAGVDFQPTEYVDISETLQAKLAMMGCHQSQLKWLKEHDGIEMLEMVKTTARFRGIQCGVRHAEAFRPYAAWGRNVVCRVLP